MDAIIGHYCQYAETYKAIESKLIKEDAHDRLPRSHGTR